MVFIGKRQTFLSKKFKFFLRFGFRSGRGHEAKRQSIKIQQFFCLCFRISYPAQTDQATTTSARILRTFLGMLDGVFPSVSSFAHFQRTRTSVQRHFSFPMKTHIFFFSVFRVVQGETKTPKIMCCCRANFAFLHALKIGTLCGK